MVGSGLRKLVDIFKSSDDVVVARPVIEVKENKVIKELENMNVEDLMEKRFIVLSPSATISEAAKIFLEKNMMETVVVDGGRLIGTVSYKDILRSLEELNLDIGPVSDMERFHKRVKSLGDIQISKILRNKTYIFPHVSLFDAIIKMEEADIAMLPVVDGNGYIIGILKEQDIIQRFLDFISK